MKLYRELCGNSTRIINTYVLFASIASCCLRNSVYSNRDSVAIISLSSSLLDSAALQTEEKVIVMERTRTDGRGCNV